MKVDSNTDNNDLLWTNNLRFIAVLSVIFLHVSSDILYDHDLMFNYTWWVGNIYDSLVRFCVPLFLMLTGALILNRKYELNEFLSKKFSRIILPFLFWSCIYAAMFLRNKISETPTISFSDIFDFLLKLLRTGSSWHFWYVYMIIGIYLFIPIVNKWILNSNEREILYFIFIWFFTLFISQPFVARFKINIDLSYFSGFLGYVILGYYLSIKSFKISSFKIKIIASLLVICGVAVTVFGTYFLTKRDNEFNGYFYDYLSINVLLVSIGVFLIFKNRKISNPLALNLINFICKYSYGIYLVHILTLKFLNKIGINNCFVNPLFAIPLVSILCLFISSFIIYVINTRVPYGKLISG
jgi:surface polysaccharide O-acyltransferase-like enzyme